MGLIPAAFCAFVRTKGCASSFPEACGRERGVTMLLVVDVGNTNTVLAVDEYGVLFRNLFAIGDVEAAEVNGIIISSVVPPMDSTLREVCERYFHLKPLFVEPGIKTGMPVLYENPQEVGADRIVNGVAADRKSVV